MGGLDLRNDTTPVEDQNGTYFTELVTSEHIRWLSEVHRKNASQPTFTYMAHEANHAPLEVPSHYIRDGCLQIPATNPSRRMLCGMMVAVDDSLRNLTNAYKSLDLWEKTVVIFSTDNGGNTDTGGSNHPLRGQKGTTWEGGVKGVGWVGGGWLKQARTNPSAHGTVSQVMLHVSDWYPTIVEGMAGLPVNVPADGTPALDGVNAWPLLIAGGALPSPSDPPALKNAVQPRTEMLLNLEPPTKTNPGQAALRLGKWKLLVGKTCRWGQQTQTYGCGSCTTRDQHPEHSPSWEQPLPVTPATSPPFCPNGWTPPPESAAPILPPPDGAGVNCKGEVPCYFPNASFIKGGVFLFDIEADPYEKHNVAAANPEVVKQLQARLAFFAAKNISQENFPVDPASSPANFGGVWTPWQGDPDPQACAIPPARIPQPMNALDGLTIAKSCFVGGWCSGPGFSGPPLTVRVLVDKALQGNTTASVHRKIAGDHGFAFPLDCDLFAKGAHKVEVDAMYEGNWCQLQYSICTRDGKVLRSCSSIVD